MALSAWPSQTDDDGTKQFGTILNKAFIDAIRASIEDNVIAVTNPTILTKTIIDEVVAARGNKANLNTRLNNSMDADGNTLAVDATEAVRGFVSISTQNIGGVKSFFSHPLFKPGASVGSAIAVSGLLNSQFSSISNGTTLETDLMSFTIPANVLSANGKIIRVTAFGTKTANVNTDTLRFYVAGVLVATKATTSAASVRWRMQADIIRTGASAQRIHCTFWAYDSAANGQELRGDDATGAFDTTATAVVKVTGQSNAAGGELTQTGFIVEAIG